MKLEEMPTKDLLVLHNRIADKPGFVQYRKAI